MYHSLGAQVFVIVGQRAEKVEAYRKCQNLTIPILIDADRSVMKQYGVYHHLGLTAFNIARPATFIIDRDRRIRFMYIGQGQGDRPDHTLLVAALEKLRLRQPASPPPERGAPPAEPVPQ